MTEILRIATTLASGRRYWDLQEELERKKTISTRKVIAYLEELHECDKIIAIEIKKHVDKYSRVNQGDG